MRSGLLTAALASTGVDAVDVAAAVALPEALGFAATATSGEPTPPPDLHVVPDDPDDQQARKRQRGRGSARRTRRRRSTRRPATGGVDREAVEELQARSLQLQSEIDELRRRLSELESSAEETDEELEEAEQAQAEAEAAHSAATKTRDAAQKALDKLTVRSVYDPGQTRPRRGSGVRLPAQPLSTRGVGRGARVVGRRSPGLEARIELPGLAQVVGRVPDPDAEAGQERRPEGGGLDDLGPLHRHAELVGLERHSRSLAQAPPSTRKGDDVGSRHRREHVAHLEGDGLQGRPHEVRPRRAAGDADDQCRGRAGPSAGAPSPVRAGTNTTPSEESTVAAIASVSAAEPTIWSPSRSHCTAAPVTKIAPSRA